MSQILQLNEVKSKSYYYAQSLSECWYYYDYYNN